MASSAVYPAWKGVAHDTVIGNFHYMGMELTFCARNKHEAERRFGALCPAGVTFHVEPLGVQTEPRPAPKKQKKAPVRVAFILSSTPQQAMEDNTENYLMQFDEGEWKDGQEPICDAIDWLEDHDYRLLQCIPDKKTGTHVLIFRKKGSGPETQPAPEAPPIIEDEAPPVLEDEIPSFEEPVASGVVRTKKAWEYGNEMIEDLRPMQKEGDPSVLWKNNLILRGIV